MTGCEYDPQAVETINGVLDDVNLRYGRDRLVVVGGSALAAWGIRPLADTDLDIVVTDSLRIDLKSKPGWYEAEFTLRQLDYYPPIANGLTAIMPPLDKGYAITADELVAEGVPCGGAGYRYSPLYRILETKSKLAGAPATRPIEIARQHKHWHDVMLIVRYLFDDSTN